MKNTLNSLLWEVRLATEQKPSYLIGTMHTRDSRAFIHLPQMEEVISRCEVFASEYDMKTFAPLRYQAASRLPQGKTLGDYLPRGVWRRMIESSPKWLGRERAEIEHLHPLLLIGMLTERSLSTESPLTLDALLAHVAEEQDKQLTGIETFEEQMQIMEALEMKELCRQLSKALRHVSAFNYAVHKNLAYYMKGDIQALYKFARRTSGSLRHILLDERNQRMAERIQLLVRQSPTAVAVGAAHLAGAKGVLRLLKHRGLLLQALPLKNE